MAEIEVVVTRAVRASVPGAVVVERPGDVPSGSVVVATAEEAGLDEVPSGCLLVLLGDDEPTVPCFLHLPAASPASAVARAVAAARASLEAETARAAQIERQRELLEIGAALSAERDVERLLERILTAARELVAADAGSLYLVEGGDGELRLRFVLAQNDSVQVPWRESLLPVNESSLAGVVAATGEPLMIDDAYALPKDAPHHFNPAFDRASGYRTRSLLVVPMTTRAGELVGVLQLINRKRDPASRLTDLRTVEQEVVGFTPSDLELVRALASQAAVVLESSRLAEEVRTLFDSFVHASITAIEQRDPPTSGHSFRVAAYTVALARAAQQRPPPSWPGLSFSPDQLQQLRYAALLHDVGKLGVREAVLTKRRRLYPDQERLVRERFGHAQRAREVELLDRTLRELVRRGVPPMTADLARVARARARIGDELRWWLAQVLTAADAGADPVEPDLLDEVASHNFPGLDGNDRRLLEDDELRLVQVGRGTLDEAERREIEAHVVHSTRFLTTLPWPRHLRRIPEIASHHHEKLHGHGYPAQLSAEEIPVEVRMLTISDIYDALTSGDRPYRTAHDPATALSVLEEEVREGAVDPDLVRVFIEAEVWKAAPTE